MFFDLFAWKVNGETKAFLFKDVISGSFLNWKQLLLFFLPQVYSTVTPIKMSFQKNSKRKAFQKK